MKLTILGVDLSLRHPFFSVKILNMDTDDSYLGSENNANITIIPSSSSCPPGVKTGNFFPIVLSGSVNEFECR